MSYTLASERAGVNARRRAVYTVSRANRWRRWARGERRVFPARAEKHFGGDDDDTAAAGCRVT